MKLKKGIPAKIGLMQVIKDYTWEVEQYQDYMLFLAEECLRQRADLVFMPEAYQYINIRNSMTPKQLSEIYADEYKEKCAVLARKYSAYVVPWDYEVCGETTYNTSYILDRTGNEIGRYRKVHPTHGEIDMGIGCGVDFPVFELDIGKVGIMICFDNYYAESARILSLKGAELILYPLYGDTVKPGWDIKTRARAADNSIYVAPCNIHSCIHDDASYTGMISPYGEVICKVPEDSVAVVKIEMGSQTTACFSGRSGVEDDKKQYLLKLRNTTAYKPLLAESENLPEWQDILSEKRNDK
jgi:predicted amidohydrolase